MGKTSDQNKEAAKVRSDTTARTAYHHGDLRAHLIEATRELIRLHGVAGFRVIDACRQAGVSTAAPYRHFRDRDALLEAVAVAGFHDMGAAMSRAAEPFSVGSEEAVTAIGQTYVEFASREAGLFRLMFAAADPERQSASGVESGGACQAVEVAGRQAYEVLLEQIARRIDRPVDDPQVVTGAFPLWTFVHGLAFLVIDDHLGVNRMPIAIDEQIRRATERLIPGVSLAEIDR